MMRHQTESHEPQGVRDREGQQPEDAELEGELDREKRPRPQVQDRAIELPQRRVENQGLLGDAGEDISMCAR